MSDPCPNSNTADKTTARPPVAVSSNSSLDSCSASADYTIRTPPIASADATLTALSNSESVTSTSVPTASFRQAQSSENINLPAVSPQLVSIDKGSVSNPLLPTDNRYIGQRLTIPMIQPAYLTISSSMSQAVPTSPAASPVGGNNNSVAEFLYQLTKMLTDDNKEVIEWVNGKIEVHNPHKLASDVLHKYFRHSKYSSFQRQLNYFGFRKLAGKGKMAPCSYVNDAATSDLSSLLRIKRKTSGTSAKDKSGRKRANSALLEGNDSESVTSSTTSIAVPQRISAQDAMYPSVNPLLAGILQNSTSFGSKRVKLEDDNDTIVKPSSAAHVAVGKGVKHQWNGYLGGAEPMVRTSTEVQSASSSNKDNDAGVASNAHALALSAVGKGVRHGLSPTLLSNHRTTVAANPATSALASHLTFLDPPQLGMDIGSSLSELTNNFRNSLNELNASESAPKPDSNEGTGSSTTADGQRSSHDMGFLSRNSSLIELAMLPTMDSIDPTPVSEMRESGSFMGFVDFPSRELDPSYKDSEGDGDENGSS